MIDFTDTIAAVSTPRGKGGIAVLRLSGADTRAVLSRVFFPAGTAPQDAPRRACFGKVKDAAGNVLDEVLCTFFPAPASFTGEDVAEISCHGGVLVTEAVLGALLTAGARAATAGEFTRRAVLYGKMDLSAAEALGALLEAKTAGQMALARGGMEGRFAEAARTLYARLAAILADIYAKIDFPDEDLNSMDRAQLSAALAQVRTRLAALAQTYRTGHAVGEGLETVICGPVNAGKSTLYNALVGRAAAIVTDVAGTTRDVLTETVALGDVTLRLSDTAGLRATADEVEKIGVDRARAALDRAELILAVFDGSAEADAAARQLLAELSTAAAPVVVVLNKRDRGAAFDCPELAEFKHVVPLFAKGEDISPLADVVRALFLADKIDIRRDAVTANARQYAALTRAAEALDRALAALAAEVPLDAACVEAEYAMRAVGEVDGREVDEDIVGEIFSHFCVGK